MTRKGVRIWNIIIICCDLLQCELDRVCLDGKKSLIESSKLATAHFLSHGLVRNHFIVFIFAVRANSCTCRHVFHEVGIVDQRY